MSGTITFYFSVINRGIKLFTVPFYILKFYMTHGRCFDAIHSMAYSAVRPEPTTISLEIKSSSYLKLPAL